MNKTPLKVSLFKRRLFIAGHEGLLQSFNIPIHVKHRLSIAYKCPNRSKPAREPDSRTILNKSHHNAKVDLLKGTFSWKSEPALSPSKLLKSPVFGVGNKLKKRNIRDSYPDIAYYTSEAELFIPDSDISRGADGTRFIYSATFTKHLNIIFGRGGWCLYPLEDIRIDQLNKGFLLSRKFGIISHDNLLCDVYSDYLLDRNTANYGVESLRSRAITLLAQKLGLGLYSHYEN